MVGRPPAFGIVLIFFVEAEQNILDQHLIYRKEDVTGRQQRCNTINYYG